MSKKINLLVGSTGFLGNEILKELGIKNISTIALGRRPIPNLPDSAKELIIDFSYLKSIDFSNINEFWIICYKDVDISKCEVPFEKDKYLVKDNIDFIRINLKKIYLR